MVAAAATDDAEGDEEEVVPTDVEATEAMLRRAMVKRAFKAASRAATTKRTAPSQREKKIGLLFLFFFGRKKQKWEKLECCEWVL